MTNVSLQFLAFSITIYFIAYLIYIIVRLTVDFEGTFEFSFLSLADRILSRESQKRSRILVRDGANVPWSYAKRRGCSMHVDPLEQ